MNAYCLNLVNFKLTTANEPQIGLSNIKRSMRQRVINNTVRCENEKSNFNNIN